MKSKVFIALTIVLCLGLCACIERSASNPTRQNPPTAQQEPTEEPAQEIAEEPTKEELKELFSKAMYEINELAFEDPTFVVRQIFDHEIEFYYDDEIIINNFPYVRTSRQYSELEDYYGQIFTVEALDWVMATKFADIDGTLYCCIAGGATGKGSKAISIEKLEGNTYKAIYEESYLDGSSSQYSTMFSIEKTDTGYRISDIGYRPTFLESPESKQDNTLESTQDMPGYTKKDLGKVSLWLPKNSVIRSNVIYEDDTELARKIAEITFVDAISDMEKPFVVYDQAYSDAETISAHKFGNYDGKSYSLQKEVSEGGMIGFQNTVVYCIAMENNVVVVTFYPQRGIGINEQREEFERILDSLE